MKRTSKRVMAVAVSLAMVLTGSTSALAATTNPARSIGIYDEVGSLAPGKRADIVLTDEELNIVKVL